LFTACGRFLRQEHIAEQVPVGVLSGLAFAGVSSEETLGRLRQFAFGLCDDICSTQNKKQWVEKTPDNVFYLDEIEQLCGQHCKFICLTRHALDVVCSLQELCEKNGIYLREVHRYIQVHPSPLKAFAHLWVDVTRRLQQFQKAHPRNTLAIRYEDLVARPSEVMTDVFGFLGVDTSSWCIDQALNQRTGIGLGDWKTYLRTGIDDASVGRWQALSNNTVAQLAEIVKPTLATCGYTLPETHLHGSAEAIRRYELGLLLQAEKSHAQ